MQRNYLDEIRNIISIKSVVEEQIKLNKKGREYIGQCPFHNEKTASFFVNDHKGFYYCFGCQAKGNIFNFYMDFYKMSFQEALESLAQKAGVEIPKNSRASFNGGSNKKIYKICEIAGEYFAKNLYNTIGENALKYLYSRGLNNETIKKFNIGFSPSNNSVLWDLLAKEGIYDEDILEVGLKATSQGTEIYDFFRNRIIFPIKDKRGKIIAFGGRALGEENPKYLNTKESIIFYKKKNLYGLYESLKNIDNDNFIVVEGYMDVVSLHQANMKTAIASLGTAVTEEHLKEIHKYDSSPIFCMDGDNAGLRATHRVIEIYLSILQSGMNPRFVFLKEYKDPDAYLQAGEKNKFKDTIQEGDSISEVLWREEANNRKLDLPEVSTQVLKKLIDKVDKIKDNALKQTYIYYFRKKIYHTGRKYNKNIYINIEEGKKLSYTAKVDAKKEQEYIMIFCLISYPEVAIEIEDKVGICKFANKNSEKLRKFFINNAKETLKKENLGNYIKNNQLEEEVNEILNSNLTKPIKLNSADEAIEVFNFTYKIFMRNSLKEESTKIQNKLKELNSDLIKIEKELQERHIEEKAERQEHKEQLLIAIEKLSYQLKDITIQILQIK